MRAYRNSTPSSCRLRPPNANGLPKPHGEDYIIKLLNEYRASWALVRQWPGHDAAIAAREAQIQHLERLVWDAVYALRQAGLGSEAAKLRRAVKNH